MLAERINRECDLLAVRPDHDLTVKIDGKPRVAAELRILHELIAYRARQADRQNAVLETVIEEDIGKIRRDHATDAEIQQRPGRVLARRSAAEILMRDQDLGLPIRLLIEHELRPLRPSVVAQRIEQVDAEPSARDRLQKARRNDFVGVDVGIGNGAATPVSVVNASIRQAPARR